MRPKAFKPIPTIARIFPSRSESATSARPRVPRMSPTTYPHGRTIRRAPSGNGPARIPATNPHPKPRMIDATPSTGSRGSHPWLPQIPFACTRLERCRGSPNRGSFAPRPRTTTAETHRAVSASPTPRLPPDPCGTVCRPSPRPAVPRRSADTLSRFLVSARSHDRLYRLTASIVAVGPWRERLQGSSWLRLDHGRRGRSCSGCSRRWSGGSRRGPPWAPDF
jgi:hypothetical protein